MIHFASSTYDIKSCKKRFTTKRGKLSAIINFIRPATHESYPHHDHRQCHNVVAKAKREHHELNFLVWRPLALGVCLLISQNSAHTEPKKNIKLKWSLCQSVASHTLRSQRKSPFEPSLWSLWSHLPALWAARISWFSSSNFLHHVKSFFASCTTSSLHTTSISFRCFMFRARQSRYWKIAIKITFRDIKLVVWWWRDVRVCVAEANDKCARVFVNCRPVISQWYFILVAYEMGD